MVERHKHRRALDRHLDEASWRHERTINGLRTFIWLSIGIALWAAATITGRPNVMGPLFVGFSVICMGLSWVLRRHYHPSIPLLSTLLDLSVLTSGTVLLCEGTFAGDDFMRLAVVNGTGMGLLLILTTNALRLDWRVAAVSGSYAVLAYLGLSISIRVGLTPYWIVDAIVLVCATMLLALSIHRSRQVAEQLFGEMRALQEQRVQVMGRLVAGAAHELNSPLGSLQSSLHTLERAVDHLRAHPDRVERSTQSMHQASESARSAIARIEEVLAALRAFARPDEASVQDLDVRQGLQGSVTLMKCQAPHGLQIEMQLDPVPSVRGNAAQLNQVFLNLLKNGAEAMKGRGRIRIRCNQEDGWVVVRIHDEGPGIPEALIEQLFEPSFQKGADRVKMGLGLAVSRSIIQDHGGELRLESREGEGTTAVVRLPTDPTLSASQPKPLALAPEGGPAHPQVAGSGS